jgi:hypothetical protein
MEGQMVEAVLLQWLYKLLNGLCMAHVALRAACVAITAFGWSIWDADQNAKSRMAFEREVFLRQLTELQRQMELIEALKPRRDLTQPAEPDEGY